MAPCKALPSFSGISRFQAQYLKPAVCTGDQRTRSFYIKGDLLRKKIKEPDLYSQRGGGSATDAENCPPQLLVKLFPSSSSASAHLVRTQGSAKHRTKPTMAQNALLNLIHNPSEVQEEVQEVHKPLE